MAWSEEQKAAARTELERRKTSETPGTYRLGFFKACAALVVCAFILALAFNKLTDGEGNALALTRDLVVLGLMLGGIAVSGSLAYIRLLDWRRSATTPGK